jgi:hypothetical protein
MFGKWVAKSWFTWNGKIPDLEGSWMSPTFIFTEQEIDPGRNDRPNSSRVETRSPIFYLKEPDNS